MPGSTPVLLEEPGEGALRTGRRGGTDTIVIFWTRMARGGGAAILLGRGRAAVLTRRVTELLELLDEGDGGPGRSADETDPLAAAVGLAGPSTPPEDPVLARLLPDGYRDDPEAAAEFRRFTENEVRRGKTEQARRVLAGLRAAPGLLWLDSEELSAWLGTLNDLRLVLGTRLGLVDDDDIPTARIHEGDPLYPVLVDYTWLTDMQERLVRAMASGLPTRSDDEDESGG